ncbi:hypothetical protein AAG906_014349 [Vitis piasezkii]
MSTPSRSRSSARGDEGYFEWRERQMHALLQETTRLREENVVLRIQENESLREFVKWFGQVVLQVEAYSMDVVLQIFKRSICPGTPFFESLAKKPPTTMDDLFRRASKYSMLEDDVRAATQILVADGHPSGGKKFQTSERPSHQAPPLMPISVSYEKLLPMIQDLSDFRWPGPIRTDPSKRDHSKKCAYHKEHGHTTERCRSLHYLVERLIKAGHLNRPKVVINYIHGGPLDEEYNSKRKRQRLLRAASVHGTIVFPSVDPTRILQPHRNALILSLGMGDFDVRRILVDPGSSMGRELFGLENPGRILSGFNGASTTSLGDIVLSVQAGLVTLNMQFSVVEDLSPFNAILGRTWLHYMKVIPSTYHQMVSFLTEDGQIDLYDSQLAARQCYQIAREVGSSKEGEPLPEPSNASDQ